MPTSTAIPPLRSDLEPFVMAEDGRTIVVLADPVSGRHFRLREVEGTILALLDGRDLDAIHRELQSMFPGRPLTLEAVARFVEQAKRLGLLEGTQAPPPPRSLLQQLLFLKIPLANPDRVLGQLYSRVSFFYQPWALAIAMLLVLAGAGVAISSAEELRRSFVPPSTLAGAALVWASVSLITLIHELGHGLTCKHFGARATGFGFLFVYFLPCFYCDVSGAWTLSRRRQRLWVGAAGLCFQFVAGAVALLVWRAVEPGTLVARVALAMASVCGADALLNLLPLIRLDGYYLLSDWLEMPNLRPRALAHVGGRLRGFLLGLPGPQMAATPRQARVLLVYGTLSGLFVVAMLAWSAESLYHWLHGRFGGLGAVATGVLLVFLVGSAARRALGLWITALRSGDGVGSRAGPRSEARDRGVGRTPPSGDRASAASETAASPLVRRGVQAPVPSDTRHPIPDTRRPLSPSPRRRALALAALVPLAAAALVLGRAEMYVVGPCRLEARRSVPVRVARTGVLSDLRYREGEWVRAGATLGLLDTFALHRELASLQARASMLRVEAEIARRQVPLVAAEREGQAAQVAVELPRAQVALDEATEVQRYRLAEAADRVAEAQAALQAAEQQATRRRRDATRAAEGDYPPVLQAHAARVQKARVEAEAEKQDVARLASLLDDGAIAVRVVDAARARHRSLEQDATAASQELLAAAKQLREEADDAEAEVERRRAAFHAAQQVYHQVERQSKPSRVAAAREEIRVRQTAIRAATARQAEAEVRRAEVDLKRLTAERVRAQIALVQKRIEQSRVVAPASGVVATPRAEQKLGRQFSVGEAVVTLDDTDHLQVRVFVDEREIGEVQPGLPVQVKIAAFPGLDFEGTVLQIARRPLAANGRNSYEVRLRVSNRDRQLRPGMTGWAKIACGRRSWAALLSRRIMRYVRTEAWSWF